MGPRSTFLPSPRSLSALHISPPGKYQSPYPSSYQCSLPLGHSYHQKRRPSPSRAHSCLSHCFSTGKRDLYYVVSSNFASDPGKDSTRRLPLPHRSLPRRAPRGPFRLVPCRGMRVTQDPDGTAPSRLHELYAMAAGDGDVRTCGYFRRQCTCVKLLKVVDVLPFSGTDIPESAYERDCA
jgi:hypothetical protein